jgi:hypothetical protein
VSRLIYDQGALVDVSLLRYNGFMWVIKFAVIAAALSLMAVSSAFAQVEIEAGKVTPPPEPRIITPPLLYETTRPPDADYYLPNVMVEHDPAFIEPFSSTYETPTGSGRMGLAGWTSPNLPVGGTLGAYSATWGVLGFGFSVTWDGPPAPKPRLR